MSAARPPEGARTAARNDAGAIRMILNESFIDAHQHFWNLERNHHPWLQDEPVSFRYGDYSALKLISDSTKRRISAPFNSPATTRP